MIYIINDNLPDTDPFHKTAIRLIDEDDDGQPEIKEIRDMDNSENYVNNTYDGWDKRFDEYLKKWNIPLEELIDNINIEIDNLDDEREIYNIESEFIRCVISSDYACIEKMVDDGYTPHSSALNTAVYKNDEDMIKYLAKNFPKTVKVDENTLPYAFKNGDKDIIDKVISWGASWKNVEFDDIINAANDNNNNLKIALQNDFKPTLDNFNNIVRIIQDPEIINMMLDTGIEIDNDTLKNTITMTKDPEIIKTMLDSGIVPNDDVAFAAIDTNNPEIVNMIINDDNEFHSNLMDHAIVASEEIFNKIKDLGYDLSANGLLHAVYSGNVDNVKRAINMSEDTEPLSFLIKYAHNTENQEIINLISKYIKNYNNKHNTNVPTE
jgi:hypothetical protein